MNEQSKLDDYLITADEACAILGGLSEPLSRAALRRGGKNGTLPRPIRIGPQTLRWSYAECVSAVNEWKNARDQFDGDRCAAARNTATTQ